MDTEGLSYDGKLKTKTVNMKCLNHDGKGKGTDFALVQKDGSEYQLKAETLDISLHAIAGDNSSWLTEQRTAGQTE